MSNAHRLARPARPTRPARPVPARRTAPRHPRQGPARARPAQPGHGGPEAPRALPPGLRLPRRRPAAADLPAHPRLPAADGAAHRQALPLPAARPGPPGEPHRRAARARRPRPVHRERRGGKPATARQGRHLQHRHPPGRPAWPALGRRQQGALPRRQGARRNSAESRAGAAAAGAGRQLEGARRHRPALCPCRRRLQPDPPVGAQRQAVRLSRAIAHGLWNKARSLAALGERLPASGYRVEVRFQKPVLLPASLTLLASAAAADGQFSLRGKDDLPHMAGHWSRLQG